MKSCGDIYQYNTYTSACIYTCTHVYTHVCTRAKLRVVLLLSKLQLTSTGGRNIESAIHTRCWPLLLDTLTDSYGRCIAHSACAHPTLRPEEIMNWMVERPGNVVTCDPKSSCSWSWLKCSFCESIFLLKRSLTAVLTTTPVEGGAIYIKFICVEKTTYHSSSVMTVKRGWQCEISVHCCGKSPSTPQQQAVLKFVLRKLLQQFCHDC